MGNEDNREHSGADRLKEKILQSRYNNSRLVRRLHVTHEKRNLRKHYTALRFNAGGTADSEDDIRPGIQVCIPGRFFMFSVVKESIEHEK